jgi:hypothetical protein
MTAFILNFEGALQRYFGWLIEQGVLEDTDGAGLPTEAEYRAHLESVLNHYMGNFTALTEMLNTAGRTDPGHTDVRMAPDVASGPGRATQPRREGGRHRLRIIA